VERRCRDETKVLSRKFTANSMSNAWSFCSVQT
jgi:hypothetical protein